MEEISYSSDTDIDYFPQKPMPVPSSDDPFNRFLQVAVSALQSTD